MHSNIDKEEKIDFIRNLVIAGTGAIPYAGGFVSFLLDKYLPSAVEKRKNLFISKIENDLEKLPMEMLRTMENDEEFHTIFIKVLRTVTAEHREEKITVFRNILINAVQLEEWSFDEKEFFIKLVDELTVDQIKIVHLLYLRDYKKTIEFESINDYIDTNWEIEKSYRWSLVTELIRKGIFSSSRERQRKKGNGTQLSTVGERFVEYIFSPVDFE